MRIGLVPGAWSYGIGSVSTVLSVWEAADRSGDEAVVFAGPHFRPLLDTLGVTAVPLPGPAEAHYPPAGSPVLRLDDLLSLSVYRSSDFVGELFERQCRAFAAQRVDVIFHDYDLTSIVAAHRLGIPVVSPVTWPDHHAFGHGTAGCRTSDTRALRAFAPILHHLPAPSPASLSELLFESSTRLVFPLPAVMDPVVGLHADGAYTGRLACTAIDTRRAGAADLGWPRPGHRAVLAYTSGPPFDVPWYVERCTEAFDGTHTDVLITAGRPGARWHHESRAGNVRVCPLAPLRRLLDRADALICHGGRNTLASAVEAGVPTIVFPGDDPERGYFSAMLARQSLAVSCVVGDWRPERLRMLVDALATAPAGAHARSTPSGGDHVVRVLREATSSPRHLSRTTAQPSGEGR